MHVERFVICVMTIKYNLLPTRFESDVCKSAIYNDSKCAEKCVDEEAGGVNGFKTSMKSFK